MRATPNLRRRLLFAVPLMVILVIAAAGFFLLGDQDLKTRSVQIPVGMSRTQVEGILGPPVLTLPRTGGRGTLLVWVDQLWQLDVLTDADGRTESVNCVPSHSFLRKTLGSVIPLPQ
jgi:hypothetical protein